MKIAIIDLGTNTFNLLVRDTQTEEIIYNDKLPVKLGEGGIDRDEIVPAAFQRGIDALKKHRETILSLRCDEVYAFATSAIRSASNGREFVKKAMEEVHVAVNVIDGFQEAELIAEGVKYALDLGEKPALIMDIGGGSTEFILANHSEIFWKNSYNIGASRLLERFKPDDPVSQKNIDQIENFHADQLSDLIDAATPYKPLTLIGSSGSFDTLAAMVAAHYEDEENPEGKTSYEFNLSRYYTIAEKMIGSNLEERLRTPGMIPMRADMIVMACIQINFILKKLDIQKLKLSAYALKEGVFYSLKTKKEKWQTSLL